MRQTMDERISTMIAGERRRKEEAKVAGQGERPTTVRAIPGHGPGTITTVDGSVRHTALDVSVQPNGWVYAVLTDGRVVAFSPAKVGHVEWTGGW